MTRTRALTRMRFSPVDRGGVDDCLSLFLVTFWLRIQAAPKYRYLLVSVSLHLCSVVFPCLF